MKKINRTMMTAAVVAAFTTVVHVFAGGKDVAAPLLASNLAEVPKITMYSVWHLVSITLGLSAAALFVGALPRHADAARYLTIFVSVLWTGFGIVFLVVALTQPESGWLFKLPQWILLLPVGILGLVGGLRGRDKST